MTLVFLNTENSQGLRQDMKTLLENSVEFITGYLKEAILQFLTKVEKFLQK